jgi:hypothetical protein
VYVSERKHAAASPPHIRTLKQTLQRDAVLHSLIPAGRDSVVVVPVVMSKGMPITRKQQIKSQRDISAKQTEFPMHSFKLTARLGMPLSNPIELIDGAWMNVRTDK